MSIISFRDMYKKFLYIECRTMVEDLFSKDVPVDFNGVFAYSYIDKEEGISFRPFLLAKIMECSVEVMNLPNLENMYMIRLRDDIGIKNKYSDENRSMYLYTISLDSCSFMDLESVGIPVEEFESVKKHVDESYQVTAELEELRSSEYEYLDHLRNEFFPDDVTCLLFKEEHGIEQIWVRLIFRKGDVFFGRLLNEPYKDFDCHNGDVIGMVLTMGTDDEDVLVFNGQTATVINTNNNATMIIEEKSLKKGKNEKYECYKKLLLERDLLKREAGSIMTAYIKAFGKLLTDAFQLKIKCISLKKSIAFCQTAVNHGELPDKSKLDRYIEESMEEYREQLQDMIEAHEKAISAKTFSDNTIRQCKTLYKRIAKTIHPDLHPNLFKDDAINELWNRSVEAYHISDLKALKELVVLVETAANEYDSAELSIEIPDIDERIKDVEEEIEEIKNTKPYSFIYILEDVIRYDEKKTEIEQEIEYYSSYAEELEQILSAYDFKEGKLCLLS